MWGRDASFAPPGVTAAVELVFKVKEPAIGAR